MHFGKYFISQLFKVLLVLTIAVKFFTLKTKIFARKENHFLQFGVSDLLSL